MEKQQPKFKILMFPWLAHGHIYPFLQLAKTISTTNHFTIYLCSTRVNLDSIEPSVQNEHSSGTDDASIIKLVELHIPSSPELPPEMHTTKNLPSSLIPALINAFQMSSSSFSDIMNSIKPNLLIYDMFQPWAAELASSKNVPSVFFSTSGATSFAFAHHRHTVGTNLSFPYKAIYLLDHERVKRDNMRAHIKSVIKDADEGTLFRNFTLSNDVVLMKTSRAVEDKYIDYLSILCEKRIVPTGPLVSNDHYVDNEEDSEMMKWLSEKNTCSTVYISFGSECFLSKEQIAEIAKGLKLCDANFLWVIRFPAGENGKTDKNIEDELPIGFLKTVNGRGRVIGKWAPQTKILAHPSIGGFVSHCGWSSIMESLYFGVPVIALPMKVDQPVNARLAVEAGVGIEIERDKNGNFVGEDVAKAISKVVSEEASGEGMRDRAKRLREEIKDNTEREANEIAEELLRVCIMKRMQ